ncbi:MaoC family dehydratase N-terminal domain-containing protein [Aliihoeflea sp. 40Bstr573]|uniref:FAS1-like dehydratase domain-containing protein n=1 Tax=Aliihoeflea sp. 40Bstr573 TaxID=2696467 RepID=UPI002096279E|nr:MaoC family dehydratase N-terminal domain-containing protein [Aliihoeflea sp. 40Bstr573]MCO6386855.1 acyl-CoA dehydrogenase [Aliihoeflea sp. 40Bstr573]
MTDYSDWVGRTRSVTDDIVRSPATRASAMLGDWSTSFTAGDATLPPLWHWFYFLEATARNATGPDGHAAKGGFVPPIPLPRRMYAGGRFTFPGDLAFGTEAEKRSSIQSVARKEGRSGPLAFVTVRHEIVQGGKVAATEEHDIVYREAEDPTASKPPAPRSEKPALSEMTVTPDEVMLFRFSALTYNGHRIHYDQPYVTGVEHYPGLIVHGPLVAMLLFERAREIAGKRPSTFSFRAMSPVFCGTAIRLVEVAGEGAMVLEARAADDRLIMTSTTDL